MSFRKDSSSTAKVVQTPARHSVSAGARNALETLLEACHTELPESVSLSPNAVEFSATSEKGDEVHLPTPLREQELAAAIKALEGLLAGAIIELRSGKKSRKIRVNMDRVTGFLMGSYLTTLDGMGKGDPRVKDKIPDTDLNRAQSVLYRRMSANLYQTKNKNEYYHIHGSLNPDPTLTMLNLPTSNPSSPTTTTSSPSSTGIQALTYPQFLSTPTAAPSSPSPSPCAPTPRHPPHPARSLPLSTTTPNTHALKGIKVLELCRVIAGPTIGRSLAAHGASVLKITSPHLPDVPFFQLDVNAGKHTIHLDLKTSSTDRAAFETLLRDADVLIDGYRPGALARLGE
ncbi:hypothetical protein N0V88_005935 [Collariella sp. IMI 366227]|nr:hypothetical protein N0V88_005935 [Collariella sp. IMI 366227]